MFDEPFIGATSLYGRCHFFRGAIVEFLELFNLSEWKPLVNTKQAALAALSQSGPLQEWDGRADNYSVVDQILTIRQQLTGDDFGDYRAEHGSAATKYFRETKKDNKKGGRRPPRKNGGKKKDDKPEKEDDDGGFFADVEEDKKTEEISEAK